MSDKPQIDTPDPDQGADARPTDQNITTTTTLTEQSIPGSQTTLSPEAPVIIQDEPVVKPPSDTTTTTITTVVKPSAITKSSPLSATKSKKAAIPIQRPKQQRKPSRRFVEEGEEEEFDPDSVNFEEVQLWLQQWFAKHAKNLPGNAVDILTTGLIRQFNIPIGPAISIVEGVFSALAGSDEDDDEDDDGYDDDYDDDYDDEDLFDEDEDDYLFDDEDEDDYLFDDEGEDGYYDEDDDDDDDYYNHYLYGEGEEGELDDFDFFNNQLGEGEYDEAFLSYLIGNRDNGEGNLDADTDSIGDKALDEKD